MRENRVIVTGGSGFIGRYLLEELSLNFKSVHVLSRRRLQLNCENVIWHTADFEEWDTIKNTLDSIRATHLVHLAWDVTGQDYWDSWENLKWMQWSLNLVKDFVNFGGKHVISSGTCAEYDWRSGILSEDTTPCNPESLYGKSKNMASLLIKQFCTVHNVRFVWGRIFYPFGPYENAEKLISSTIDHVLKSNVAICKSPNNIVDYIYVKDVARLFSKLAVSDFSGYVNVSSGQPWMVKDILYKIEELLGKSGLIVFEEDPQAPRKIVVGDNVKTKREISWKPLYSLETGLLETIKWRQNINTLE